MVQVELDLERAKFASLEALRHELEASREEFGGEKGRSSTLEGQFLRVKATKQEGIAMWSGSMPSR